MNNKYLVKAASRFLGETYNIEEARKTGFIFNARMENGKMVVIFNVDAINLLANNCGLTITDDIPIGEKIEELELNLDGDEDISNSINQFEDEFIKKVKAVDNKIDVSWIEDIMEPSATLEFSIYNSKNKDDIDMIFEKE